MKQLLVSLFVVLIFVSCKKDRINGDNFQPMDEFFNENKVEEQEFVINQEDTVGPITGNQGTKLYGGKQLFKYSDRADAIDFPYIIKLVELYKYKDVICWEMPTPHSAGALNNGGEIRVRAFKDVEELVLKPNLAYKAVFSSTVSDTAKNVFQGKVAADDSFESWNLATDNSTVSIESNKYAALTYKMGWITPAKNEAASGKTDVEFTVTGNGGAYINLAICFKDFHCALTGNNLVLTDVPVGESATIIAMAKDQDGNFRLHQETVTTSAGMKIQLDMKTVTETELLAVLEGL